MHLFHCTRDYFRKLVDLIKDHPSMKSQGTRKLHPELLVLMTLKFFGSEGNGATANRVKDGLGFSGKGSVMSYVERTVDALLSLESDMVFWPDAEERKEIAARIEAVSHFPKCVMGLAFKPEPLC